MLLVATAASAQQAEVVAVFNFAQRDDDPQYAWLSKGLADLLINQLADLPNLTVVSRDRMQTISAEYQRLAARPTFDPREDAPPVARALKAERIVFGTCAVREGTATIAAQVTRIVDESVLFETRTSGPYKDVLDLEREIGRRLRAFFLGKPVEQVPLADVPQWTTTVSAAEHLYAGVDLFDRGQFAEAWHRFRQAGRLDSSFADAVYWQGRMLYYLMLYENARPLLERFFTAWPLHPRAGDAAIEMLDSYRQSQDDPEVLRDTYLRLRNQVDARTVVHNKSTPGLETQTLLKTYLGGFAVQAERALDRYDAAADLALVLQEESYEAFKSSGVDKAHWGLYDQLACFTAMERRMYCDRFVFNKNMFDREWRMLSLTNIKPEWKKLYTENRRMRPIMLREGNRYRVSGCRHLLWWLVAPEGKVFTNVTAEVESHHEAGTPSFLILLGYGVWSDIESDLFLGSTGDGVIKKKLNLPDQCRMFCVRLTTQPDHFGSAAGTDYFVDEPLSDYVERFQITYAQEPARKDVGRIRVRLENTEKARVELDGKPALLVDGIIHGATPGEHALRAWAAKGEDCERSSIFMPVEQAVTVSQGQTTDCPLKFPLRPLRAMTGWQSAQIVCGQYPLAALPPATGQEELTRPSLLRVTRGPLAGRLVALWSYHEEIWISYSSDDGASWSPAEHLPVPVNSAHVEMAPRLIEDESGRLCLTFISDRNIERAHYPYLTTSEDLEHWTAPRKIADIVCDSLVMLQNQAGQYVLLLPPPYRGAELGMSIRWLTGSIAEEMPVDTVSAYGKKYARKTFTFLVSDDLEHWTELPSHLGDERVREADLLQAADGTYHAVYTSLDKLRSFGDSMWRVCHQKSRDLVNWSPPEDLLSAPWEYRNPVITTDGQRVFGTISVSGNNVHRFNLDHPDEVSWWGFVGTRNILYHDPPAYGNRLHWLWLCFEGNPQYYQPNGGKVYYSQRPSDRGEWLLEWPKQLPPDSPEEVREKHRVRALADARAVPPGRSWENPREFRHQSYPYRIEVPADWKSLPADDATRMGFLGPVRYGILQPYVDVFVWEPGSLNRHFPYGFARLRNRALQIPI
ncbi:MAG: hypothetical protein JXL80_12935 [Planctomycetes bacterium]|nr:hypothetical protein [Planctomycetota bacterium]